MNRKLGAAYKNGNVEFTVWAPEVENVEIDIISPHKNSISLVKDELGYWSTEVADVKPGTLYFYNLNKDKQFPDPASQSQPQGVHGPSQVIDHQSFAWSDQSWKGLPLRSMILYELHTGTFSPEGTFDGVIGKIPHLLELGINAIEIMPVGQFPGGRNWGYDGVFPFAVQDSYGGVAGLKRLVNACHQAGIAVVLDVVYNHMGPEGNYLSAYGPYFTDKYGTPWGMALNFDDAYSDEVRNFFLQNALMWFRDFHIDALRLDAIHAMKDLSARHFLQDLAQQVAQLGKQLNRELVLIGECDLNDPKFINPIEKSGFGLDGQWSDEFHHSLHTLVTGELNGYYSDFGSLEHLRKAFQDSFVYTGQYSQHRKKTFGAVPKENAYSQFVVFAQNHDHIGNRMLGDRISKSVSFEELKLIAGAYLISPYVPLLFMGEEFGEDRPFMYFISHTDSELVEAVRAGRKKEFEYFQRELGADEGEVPDPQSEETFEQCKLNWNFAEDNAKAILFNFYKQLIQFRKLNPAFQVDERATMKVQSDDSNQTLIIQRFGQRTWETPLFCAILNFGSEDAEITLPSQSGYWQKFLDSSEEKWLGPGSNSPFSLTSGESFSIKKKSLLIYENREAGGKMVEFEL